MPKTSAELTASIIIDKNDLMSQALKQLSVAQKELKKNKLEIFFDLSNADLSKKLQECQKQLSSKDYTIKINNNGIEETYKSLDKLLDIIKNIASGKDFGASFGSINTENATKQINKLEVKISELTKKCEELQKKSSSVSSVSNYSKDVNLVDNKEFQKLSKSFEKIKGEVDDLKTHINLLDDSVVSGEQFAKLGDQVSSLSVKFDDLISKYHDLLNVQKALSSALQETNISNGDVNQKKDAFQDKDISASTEAVTNAIKEENSVLEQNTQKVKENTQAKEQNKNVDLSKYDKRLEKYEGNISKYDAKIDNFKEGGWASPEYLKNVQAVTDEVKKYRDLLDDIKVNKNGIASDEDIKNLDSGKKKIEEAISAVTNMSAAQKGYNFVSGQKELDKIHKLLKDNSAMSQKAKAQIKEYYRQIASGNPSASLDVIHGKILEIVNAEIEAGRGGKRFLDAIKEKAWHGAAGVIGTYFSVDDAINAVKEMASTVIDLNTQITELAKVSEASSSQIYADFSSYANIAKEVRGTISDTISATADWSKNGYSLPDAKQLAEVSQLYKNVGDGIDINTANESLISTLKGFQLNADQAEHIVDVFNEVDILASYCSNVLALCVYMHIEVAQNGGHSEKDNTVGKI